MQPDNNLSPHAKAVLTFIQAVGFMILSGIYWNRLYKMLLKAPDGLSALSPLILGGAVMSSDRKKCERLQSHILWAEKYSVIAKVMATLKASSRQNTSEFPVFLMIFTAIGLLPINNALKPFHRSDITV